MGVDTGVARRPLIFRKEAYLADLVRHPTVVRLLDAYLVESRVHLVYELAQQDLCCFLVASAGHLGSDAIRSTSFEVLTALRHIHQCGLIHTDVKPTNIFIRTTSPWVCILGDVGCAVEVEGLSVARGFAVTYVRTYFSKRTYARTCVRRRMLALLATDKSSRGWCRKPLRR